MLNFEVTFVQTVDIDTRHCNMQINKKCSNETETASYGNPFSVLLRH